MKLKDIMTPDVEVIRPDASVAEAAAKMRELDVGPLPVCDGERVVGMITDRDITVRATAEGQDPRNLKVRDVMTHDVVYCYEDDEVDAAGRVMSEKQIRRLLVLDRNKRLVGIVALGDLAVDTGRTDLSGRVLKNVSEPAEPER